MIWDGDASLLELCPVLDAACKNEASELAVLTPM